MADGIVVGSMVKNAAEEVRATLTHFNGHNLLDLRIYSQYRSTGEVGPTKKGITVRLDALAELRELLEQAECEARSRGLLD